MYQRRNRLPIWYTRQAHTQATAHWNSATHAAPQPERISRLTAAMAATQGEYSSVNVKKLNAASGDVVLGAKTVVQAVAYSKRVAEAMHSYMQGMPAQGRAMGPDGAQR